MKIESFHKNMRKQNNPMTKTFNPSIWSWLSEPISNLPSCKNVFPDSKDRRIPHTIMLLEKFLK